MIGGALSFHSGSSTGIECEGPPDSASGYDVDCNTKGSAIMVISAWGSVLKLQDMVAYGTLDC